METIAYGAKLRDEQQLLQSSSGGAFTALSDTVLKAGGVIAASVYDYEKKEVVFRLLETAEERNQARGSKYIQSNPGTIYADCLRWLKEHADKPLMFVGTGCQTEAFRKYLDIAGKKERERVVLVDLICHGVPSPKLWQEYLAALEKKQQRTVQFISFRDKRNGWKRSTSVAKFSDGECMITDYAKVYHSHCMLREACYSCPFTKLHRESDITIGDFWGIEKHYPEKNDARGVSLVLIHTPSGSELWTEASKVMEVFAVPTENCMQDRLRTPTDKAPIEQQFWTDYQKNGIHYVMKKYGTDSFMKRVRRKVKKLLRR